MNLSGDKRLTGVHDRRSGLKSNDGLHEFVNKTVDKNIQNRNEMLNVVIINSHVSHSLYISVQDDALHR